MPVDPPPAHLPRIASLGESADGPPLPPVRTQQQLSVHTPPTSFHGVTANLELKHVLNTSMGQPLTGSCRPRRLYGSESPPPNPQKSLNQVPDAPVGLAAWGVSPNSQLDLASMC